jgi:hypothetical protein
MNTPVRPDPTPLQQFKYNSKVRLVRGFREIAIRKFGYIATKFDADVHTNKLRSFFARVAPMRSQHPLIRLGNAHDGGYLVPDDLVGVKTCFSPGVSDMSDFERALAGRGILCNLADNSVDAPAWHDDLIHFEKKFLGATNDDTYMTLDSWVERLADPQDRELILQMDIEGDEYDVLLQASPEVLRRFRIAVVEFHYLDSIFDQAGFKLIDTTFARLLRIFHVVHLHPNNSCEPISFGQYGVPPVMEVTLLRQDRFTCVQPVTQLPHPLDSPCARWREDLAVPACWYR